jgi:hypothetical protein
VGPHGRGEDLGDSPGRIGLTVIEWTAIGIGLAVTQRQLTKLVDLDEAGKKSLPQQPRKGGTRPRRSCTIYRPDDVLKQWCHDTDDPEENKLK